MGNAAKLSLFHSTDAEGTLGSLIGGAKSSGLGHQFKKIKHQTVQGCGKQGSVIRLAQHNLMSKRASHNDRWALAKE